MNTWPHSLLQPANEHIRRQTEGKQLPPDFLKEEAIMSFALQPNKRLKDNGRPSWEILISELKHRAGDLHKEVRFIG